MKNGGSYLLLVYLRKNRIIEAGGLGKHVFAAGFYAYCGSAKNGIEQRVARHAGKHGKRLHWHIDYLLAKREAKLIEAWAFHGTTPTECDLVAALVERLGGEATIAGFGASDCRRCPAHLLYFAEKPDFARLPWKSATLLLSASEAPRI